MFKSLQTLRKRDETWVYQGEKGRIAGGGPKVQTASYKKKLGMLTLQQDAYS